jgi:hypothetical protein
MTSVIARPCGQGAPMDRSTIRSPIRWCSATMPAVIPPPAGLARLNGLFPDGKALMWGDKAWQGERPISARISG